MKREEHNTKLLRQRAEEVANEKGIMKQSPQPSRQYKNSLQLLEKTFASLRGAVFIIDAKTTRILNCNPAASQIFGYRKEEMLGQTTNFLHVDEERLEEFRKSLFPAVEESGCLDLPEFQMKRRNGEVFFTSHTVMPLEDDQGKRIAWVSVVRDITDRKRAEEELKEYQRAVEGSQDMIAVVDQKYKYLIANKAFLRYQGMNREQVVGRSVSEVIGKDDFEGLVKGNLEACFQGEVIQYEMKRTYSELGETDLSVSYFPIEGSRGIVNSVVAVIRDITEYKKAEEQVRQSETKYRKLHESMMDGFVFVTMDGMIKEYNRTYLQMLGYTSEEILKLTYRDLTPEKWHDFEQKIVKEQVLPRGYSDVYEKEYRKKDGTIFPVELRTFLIKDDTGSNFGMWAIIRDISERKRAEEALRKTEEEAKRLAVENTVMAEIGRIISSTLEIETVYERFSKEVRRIVPLDRITINIIDYKENTFTILYTSGLEIPGRQKGTIISLAGGATDEVIRTKRPLHIQEDEETHRRFPSLLPVFLAGFRSLIFIPMISQDKVIGVLGLLSTQPKAYTEKERRVAERVGNQIAGAIANAQLFNDLKDTEQSFRQSELFLRNVLDALPISVSITDKNGKVLLNNPARNKIWGGEEFKGISQLGKYKGWWADTGKKAEEDEWGLARAVKEGKTSLNRMMHIETFDGQEKTILNSGVPIRDKSGEIIGAISVNQDITELKRVESQVKKLLQSVSEKQKELRALTARLSEVEEEERRRLARELHDRVGQNLTALGLNLNILRTLLQSEGEAKTGKVMEDSLRLVAETIGDIRNLMSELHPPLMDEYGLLAALRCYGEQFSERTGVAMAVRGNDRMQRLSSNKEIALFRIAQEALTNVAKHARASHVTVTLERVDKKTVMSLADDGVGFDNRGYPSQRKPDSWGFITIRERAEAIGGQVKIESEPEKGTRIIVEVGG